MELWDDSLGETEAAAAAAPDSLQFPHSELRSKLPLVPATVLSKIGKLIKSCNPRAQACGPSYIVDQPRIELDRGGARTEGEEGRRGVYDTSFQPENLLNTV